MSLDIEKLVDVEIDRLEAAMLECSQEIVEFPLVHTFFPKLYMRQILMRADTFLSSRIHKTTHPFFVMKGKVTVFGSKTGVQKIEAPYCGTTLAGTRRVLNVHEDCIWVTIHPLDYITGEENRWSEKKKEDLIKKIENDLLQPRINSITNTDTHEDYKKELKQRRIA